MSKKQLRSYETRTRLLKAAEEIFAQHGYDASGVSKICHSAGVSKGAFYHHFSSKQEIFLELLKRWLANLDAEISRLREKTASFPDELLSMAGVVRDVLLAAKNRLPIYLEFWIQAMRDPEIMQALIEPFHRYRTLFSEMVKEGISEGTLRDVSPEAAARMIITVALGLLIQGLLDPIEVNWKQMTEESIEILLEGMIKR